MVNQGRYFTKNGPVSKITGAARALDGSDEEVSSSANIQTEALVALLTDALERELG